MLLDQHLYNTEVKDFTRLQAKTQISSRLFSFTVLQIVFHLLPKVIALSAELVF